MKYKKNIYSDPNRIKYHNFHLQNIIKSDIFEKFIGKLVISVENQK